MSTILGIRRAAEFSPNNTGNDSLIFSLVSEELTRRGHKVRQLTEEEFFHTENIDEQLIFSMVRNIKNVEKLKMLEQEGRQVINSGLAIENCFRATMTELLLNNKIPHPLCATIPTTADAQQAFEELGGRNVWIKRGDFHTVHKEDIAFCQTYTEGNSILKEFALRGIPNAVLAQHLKGDLVKFYAVAGTPFFYWFYPFDANHLMMGAQDPEQTQHYNFDVNELQAIASKAAKVLGVQIYGGDAIISADHQLKLIDLNDWPSFAPCRDESAKYIADAIVNAKK